MPHPYLPTPAEFVNAMREVLDLDPIPYTSDTEQAHCYERAFGAVQIATFSAYDAGRAAGMARGRRTERWL